MDELRTKWKGQRMITSCILERNDKWNVRIIEKIRLTVLNVEYKISLSPILKRMKKEC